MTTLPVSILCGSVLATGALLAAVDAPASKGRTTLELKSETEIVFLGISGDYRALEPEKMAEMLATAHELELFGESLRASTNDEDRVWAVRSKKSADKLAKDLRKSLKKIDFTAKPLVATVMASLPGTKEKTVRNVSRGLERAEDKVYTVFSERGSDQLWVFHESKLKSKKLEELFRDYDLTLAFHHQEYEVAPAGEKSAEADLDSLVGSADEKLDLVRSSRREDVLVLDLYLRDLSSLQLLEKGTKSYLCPAFGGTLLADMPQGVQWNVTLSVDGFPFLD